MLPHPSVPAFDLDNALFCARMSALAYPEKGEGEANYRERVGHYFTRIAHPACTVRHFACAATNTQGFVAASTTALVVAFRGSREPADFITDARIHKTECTWGHVHQGFHAAWESVEVEVIHAVQSLRTRLTQPVFIAGHSLGGALAMLAAPAIARISDAPPRVYTYGQPRVGDAAFAYEYDTLLLDTTFRFVNNEDPVPRLPCFLHNFKHAGHELFNNHCGCLTVDPPLWRKLVNDAVGIVSDWRRGRLALLPDHSIQHYIARLEALNHQDTKIPS